MRKKPLPLELYPFRRDLKAGAKAFKVSERTFRRWLEGYALFEPKKGWGPGKLNASTVCQIRKLGMSDQYTQTELAEIFNVSQAMVGRIINNVSHKRDFILGGSAKYTSQDMLNNDVII